MQRCKIIHFKKVGILIFLITTSLWSLDLYQGYKEVGPQLLKNSDFSKNLFQWLVSAEDLSHIVVNNGGVEINSDEINIAPQLVQVVSPVYEGRKYILRAKIQTLDITVRGNSWQTGRVVLVQYKKDKPLLNTPHLLVALNSTHDWESYEFVVELQPNVSELRLKIQLNECEGKLLLKDLQLHLAEESRNYQIVKVVLFALWQIFILNIFFDQIYLVQINFSSFVLILLIIIAIILGATIPSDIKMTVTQQVNYYLREVVGHFLMLCEVSRGDSESMLQKLPMNDVLISKFAHFILFLMLGYLLVIGRSKISMVQILFSIFALACATEMMQLYIEGRSALKTDVFIDLLGATLGFFIGYTINQYKKIDE